MQGMAVGRAVDLTTLEGYGQLIDELEKMFDIKENFALVISGRSSSLTMKEIRCSWATTHGSKSCT